MLNCQVTYIKLTVHRRYNGLTSTICNCTVRNLLVPILCRLDILDRVVCNIYQHPRKTQVWNIHLLSFLFHTNLFQGKSLLASFGSWSWNGKKNKVKNNFETANICRWIRNFKRIDRENCSLFHLDVGAGSEKSTVMTSSNFKQLHLNIFLRRLIEISELPLMHYKLIFRFCSSCIWLLARTARPWIKIFWFDFLISMSHYWKRGFNGVMSLVKIL